MNTSRIISSSMAAFAALSVFVVMAPAAHAEITGSTAVDARMRSGPSTSNRVVGGVRAGDTLRDIRATGRYHDGYQWLRVRYRGRVGYIWGAMVCTSQYINGSQECNNRNQNSGNNTGNSNGNGGGGFRTVTYWCGGEGMPLVVKFGEEGNESVAYVSHDGGPQIRLVKPWGSNGDQYFAGKIGIYGRNGQLTYDEGDFKQNCRK